MNSVFPLYFNITFCKRVINMKYDLFMNMTINLACKLIHDFFIIYGMEKCTDSLPGSGEYSILLID
jgi:hypothetical protein